MKKSFFLLIFAIVSTNSWAVRLSDYRPYSFEVLFTNPVCKTYQYSRAMITGSGKTIAAKPDDVYCKSSDEDASVSRRNSPQYRLIQWITARETKEIRAAYLSFRSRNIVGAFCMALRNGAKVSLVLDGDPVRETNPDAESLRKCGDIKITYRGNTGGLGYAHNKILLVKGTDANVTRVVFSSGNMTTGTSINHENWNFVTTSSKSYFAQTHECVLAAMVEAGDTKNNFKEYLNACRRTIAASPETDISVYFSPVDGAAALRRITDAGMNSRLIEGISHRLSGAIAKTLASLLQAGKEIKFILDDDIYWAEKLKEDVGRNSTFEAYKIYNDLIRKGMNTRFLETNQTIYQLQHNKFLIFTFPYGGAVFTGAGNMTTAAFTKNFENFYYITIPEVVEAYNRQYDLYFNKMATSMEDMPRVYELP